MSQHKYNVTVLLPTRGRTDTLKRSLISLGNRALEKDRIQIRLGFDEDDQASYDFFEEEIAPWLEEKGIDFESFEFTPMGYVGLNQYYNTLAKNADTDWFFVWNDDALMETTGWDKIIASKTGEFKLLSVRTHRDHPYSIFPIIPSEWYDLLGYFSHHQMIDAEVSHVAYMLDIFERVAIHCTHDRYDLTGNNLNDTFKNRVLLEGNPSSPLDYSHPNYVNARIKDTEFLSKHLVAKGLDTTWWENIKAGKQDPWEKLAANDPNNQTTRTPR